jgi:hypothetical protein
MGSGSNCMGFSKDSSSGYDWLPDQGVANKANRGALKPMLLQKTLEIEKRLCKLMKSGLKPTIVKYVLPIVNPYYEKQRLIFSSTKRPSRVCGWIGFPMDINMMSSITLVRQH